MGTPSLLTARNLSGSSSCNQFFVTASSNLCGSVREYYDRLSQKKKKTEMTRQTSPIASFDRLTPEDFPLFLTFREFLFLIDRSTPKSFLHPSISVSSAASMEIGAAYRKAISELGCHKEGKRQHKQRQKLIGLEVDFARFRNHYWPHFPRELVSRVDCFLVFSEIMSIVKGSVLLGAPSQSLTEDEYLEVSEKRSNLFSSTEERKAIYSLFCAYQQKKKEKGDFDLLDVSQSVYNQLIQGKTFFFFFFFIHIFSHPFQRWV